MRKNLETKWQSTNFQGGSEFTRASEGPQNGGKMTGMDLLEFRDIKGPDPMPKYGAIWLIGSRGGIPPPGLFRVKVFLKWVIIEFTKEIFLNIQF